MTSSDNLISMDPSWIFRNTFPDTWLPDNFSIETDTLTKALQKSFQTQDFENINFSEEFISPWLNTSDTTATVSGGSAETDNNNSKTRRNGVAASGKIGKRKSRASKKSTTTFINADPANFRQLVQQVTGIKFSGQLLKPEPHRARLQLIGGGGGGGGVGGGGGGGLPMLDTSAFLVEPTYENNQVGPAFSFPPPPEVVGNGGAASSSQFDFDSFCSFPTLESWKGV